MLPSHELTSYIDPYFSTTIRTCAPSGSWATHLRLCDSTANGASRSVDAQSHSKIPTLRRGSCGIHSAHTSKKQKNTVGTVYQQPPLVFRE